LEGRVPWRRVCLPFSFSTNKVLPVFYFKVRFLTIKQNRSPEDVTHRIDRLIHEIRTKYHAPVIGKPKHTTPPSDVLLVAHGHILRAFAMRWAGKTLQDGPTFLLEAGGVGTLSYEHHRIEEPAILLGGGFMVDVVEVCCLLGIGGCTPCSPLLLEILCICLLGLVLGFAIWLFSCANFTTRPQRKMRRKKHKQKEIGKKQS